MTLLEQVQAMDPAQRIKVGGNRGICYFYIGTAGDLAATLAQFGNADLRGRVVVETRPADEAADPGTVAIMVEGTDRGRFWTTTERDGPCLEYGWGWF